VQRAHKVNDAHRVRPPAHEEEVHAVAYRPARGSPARGLVPRSAAAPRALRVGRRGGTPVNEVPNEDEAAALCVIASAIVPEPVQKRKERSGLPPAPLSLFALLGRPRCNSRRAAAGRRARAGRREKLVA